jgi:hypothetical protein
MIKVRKYEEKDFDGVRYACLNSDGGGMSADLCAFVLHTFCDYYIENEPENCFVLDDNGKAVGYVICTEDYDNYKEIFDEFYREHINLSEIDWEKKVKQWNKQIDDVDFAGKLVSFNYLFESNDFKEIDKQIRFLIEARGRCILSLLK